MAPAGRLRVAALGFASSEEKPVERAYVKAPEAPEKQTVAEAKKKSDGCLTCHSARENGLVRWPRT